jgi:parallel beta-helix repeat protein
MKRYILLSTALLIFPFSVSGYAAEIGCGEIVLNNVKLETNLDCRESGFGGLIIGADDVTVDLNGYTIAGDVTAFAGVSVEGHSGIRVKNGAIFGFQVGAHVVDCEDVKFERLVFAYQANDGIGISQSRAIKIQDIEVSLEYTGDPETTAIALVDVVGAKLTGLTVEGSFYGLKSERSSDVKVESSSFTSISHVGVRLEQNSHTSIRGNRISGTRLAECYSAFDAIGPGPNLHIQVQDNVLTGCAHGVFVEALSASLPSRNFTIRNNRIRLTGDGIRLVGLQDSEIIGNRVHFNEAGVRLWDYSYNNLIAENLATGNVYWDLFHDDSSDPNTWRDNTCVTSNMGDIDCP